MFHQLMELINNNEYQRDSKQGASGRETDRFDGQQRLLRFLRQLVWAELLKSLQRLFSRESSIFHSVSQLIGSQQAFG